MEEAESQEHRYLDNVCLSQDLNSIFVLILRFLFSFSLSIILVVMMRSKEFKTSRSILMLMLSLINAAAHSATSEREH